MTSELRQGGFNRVEPRFLPEEVGVEPREIHMRKMKRKWASCSSKGRLTFDTSLLDETNEVRSRTILHELLHLKYPNHGRLFNILLNIYLERKAEDYVKDQDTVAE